MKFLLSLLMMVSLIITGCTSSKTTENRASSAGNEAAYTAVDDSGQKLSFTHKPQRIISLTYGTDEILVDVVEIKRIIAMSRWAEDEGITFITSEQYAKVGRKAYDNTEDIIAMQPDLVVASTATSKEIVDRLRENGLKVYIARSPHTYKEMCDKVQNLATAVGEKQKGAELIEQMDKRIAFVDQKLKAYTGDKRKVAVAFNFNSPMGRRGDLLDNMMTMAHIVNGAAAYDPGIKGQPVISKEQVVLINPDVFLLPTWNGGKKKDVQAFADTLRHDPAYQNIKAVKNDDLVFVDDKYRYVASHHVAEAVETFAKGVYPEAFK